MSSGVPSALTTAVSPDVPTLRDALRIGTRHLHDRTESAFVLGAADLARSEYVAVLGRLLGLHTAAEAALAPWARALTAYGVVLGERIKAPLLRRDLAALGCPAVPADSTCPAPVVEAPSLAHAFGVLYVLEGSTLGGQLLRRQVEAALHLGPETGLAFLGAYGADVGPMWRAYVHALDRFDVALAPGARPGAHANVLAGARATFVAFERWVVAPTARSSAPPPVAILA